MKQKRNFKEFTHIFEAITSFDSVGKNLKEFIFNHPAFKKIWQKNVKFMSAEVTKPHTNEAGSAEVKPIEINTSKPENESLIKERRKITKEIEQVYKLSLPDEWLQKYPAL